MKDNNKSVTESSSQFDHLEEMSVHELLSNINKEDAKVHIAVQKAIPQIEDLVKRIVVRMEKGGRIFYLGAGNKWQAGRS